MNAPVKLAYSACPHDCPSTCALEVEVLTPERIGRVRGAKDNSYTDGVICAKVARYAERVHHPDRLMHPMIRTGPKGSGQFRQATWDEAMTVVVEGLQAAERDFGAESVWPYYYAGTMGLVMRDGINRLRHAKRYSRMHATFCTTMAFSGYITGTGKLAGADPREMAKSDCVVIWGTNPVNTQVNVMTHAMKARKERGAKIVVIDIYRNGTLVHHETVDTPTLDWTWTDRGQPRSERYYYVRVAAQPALAQATPAVAYASPTWIHSPPH